MCGDARGNSPVDDVVLVHGSCETGLTADGVPFARGFLDRSRGALFLRRWCETRAGLLQARRRALQF